MSEGTSYLTTVLPVNKKGVGKSTHVIVDTLRHPAVELTQVEEAHRQETGSESGNGAADGNGGAGEWAVLAGTVVGSAGCVTVLVVASLVMRFCVCPGTAARRGAARAGTTHQTK